ncbi:HNH endonuclease signature motif containing protein [Angustibacter luteus]|uniref:DUF222 domain-containing protein n=1 Tax=Angustibacter luteus TaxID=658456 RepID=A0ABW1JCL8_9ACTN
MTSAPGDGVDAASAALADALEAISRFAQIPAWRLADGQLTEAVAGLDALTRRVGAQSVRVVAEASSRGLPAQAGHGRATGWIRQAVPTMSPRDAATLARRADALYPGPGAVDLEPTRAAVLSGSVALDQAEVLTTTLSALQPPTVPAGTIDEDTLDEAQTFLLDQSAAFDASKLTRIAAYLRHRLDPDADERLARDEAARERARTLSIHTLTSGMVHLEGALTPECGAALRTAIDAWSAPQPAADGSPDPRTAAQRRHDGLHRLAASAVATPELLPTTHGSPYRVVVTVPHTTLVAALPDGTRLSSDALRTLTCDSEVVPVLVDDLGNPLDVGDTQYSFPAKQRLAIAVRDQHCTYRGCTAPPAWCDVHHLIPFSQGGRTAVHNGALLCGRHHRHVHATGQTGRVEHGHVTWGTGPPDHQVADANCATQAVEALVRRYLTRMRR